MSRVNWAVEKHDLELLKRLIAEGADVNKSINCRMPLDLAWELGNAAALDVLLAAGAKGASWEEDIDSVGCLRCKSVEVLDAFLRHHDVDWVDEDGETKLFDAAVRDEAAFAEFLIQRGASLTVKNAIGKTPLEMAQSSGKAKQAYLLGVAMGLAPADLGMEIKQAIATGTARTDKILGAPLLQWASYLGSHDLTKELLSLGADPNEECWEGRAALYFGAQFGNVAVVAALIAAGAEIDPGFVDGRETHAYYALKAKNMEVAEYLVEKGSKVTSGCIHYAAEYGDSELVTKLLKRPLAKSQSAVNEWDWIDLAKTFAWTGRTDVYRSLMAAIPGAHVNIARSQALKVACQRNQVEFVELLLADGAAVDEDTIGLSPLQIAFSNGAVEVVKKLVAAGANPNQGIRAELEKCEGEIWGEGSEEFYRDIVEKKGRESAGTITARRWLCLKELVKAGAWLNYNHTFNDSVWSWLGSTSDENARVTWRKTLAWAGRQREIAALRKLPIRRKQTDKQISLFGA